MSKGLDTFVRLRDFEQSRVSMERARKAQSQREADEARDEANTQLSELQNSRGAMLQKPVLDLGRLHEVAVMEARAADLLEQREETSRKAHAEHETAIAAHWQARVQVEVATTAATRRRDTEFEHAEKQEFDRMADLHAISKERTR